MIIGIACSKGARVKLEFTLPDIREVSRLKGEVVGKKLERQERQMETTRMITERCADLKREIQDYADKLRLLVDSLQHCSEISFQLFRNVQRHNNQFLSSYSKD